MLVRRHRQRDVERGGALVGIVRVDDQRFGQLARRAGEARQDQHALLVVACGNEFLRHQIHPVVQAADETEVRGAMVFVDQLRLVMLGDQDDRRITGIGILTVDLLRKLPNPIEVVAILADRAARRRGDLNE